MHGASVVGTAGTEMPFALMCEGRVEQSRYQFSVICVFLCRSLL